MQKKLETTHYILTFVSIVVLVGAFATQIITGTAALVAMDSLAGSVMLGIVFLCYLGWFVLEAADSQGISRNQAAVQILKSSPVAWCIYAFWGVFICIPVVLSLT